MVDTNKINYDVKVEFVYGQNHARYLGNIKDQYADIYYHYGVRDDGKYFVLTEFPDTQNRIQIIAKRDYLKVLKVPGFNSDNLRFII
jgi:hypothetical protein